MADGYAIKQVYNKAENWPEKTKFIALATSTICDRQTLSHKKLSQL
jgi:hypothetical protein